MPSSPLAFHHLPMLLILVVVMANSIVAFPGKIDPIVQPGGKAPPKKGFQEHADYNIVRIQVCRITPFPSDIDHASILQKLDLKFENERTELIAQNDKNGEVMVNEGEAIGLPQVMHANEAIKGPFQAGPVHADMDLVEVGNVEMAEQLRKMGDQGDEYASLILYGPTRKYFSAKAGFVQRETRLARNLYCVKELAHSIQYGLNKEEKENMEKYKVQYAILGVFINGEKPESEKGKSIIDVMKSVMKTRGELAKLVNKPANFIYNGTDRDDIRRLRNEAFDGFAELARRESEDGDGKPSNGSSMALVGAMWQWETNDCGNKCVFFYHISANDSYIPNYGDSFETLF